VYSPTGLGLATCRISSSLVPGDGCGDGVDLGCRLDDCVDSRFCHPAKNGIWLSWVEAFRPRTNPPVLSAISCADPTRRPFFSAFSALWSVFR